MMQRKSFCEDFGFKIQDSKFNELFIGNEFIWVPV